MKFELPLPPSTNNLFINAKGPRGGRIKAPRYREWETAAGWEIARQRRGQEKVTEPVSLIYEVDDTAKLDLGNSEKAVTDLLVAHSVIRDDNRNVVREITLRWAKVKGVRVTIVPASA